MSQQEQFLDVIDRDEAQRRFHAAIDLAPLGDEIVPLDAALARVLARDVVATVDVPSFDRSNYDGFAVRAADTFGADEQTPRQLRLVDQRLDPGVLPTIEVTTGTAAPIATGGMLPRGADAVVMIEHSDSGPAGASAGAELVVRRAVTSGFGISFAATDIATGETVARAGTLLTSRETGVLAAVGVAEVCVWRRPRVAILSTGDEVIAPGAALAPGTVYDSNGRILADAVRELGGVPIESGVVRDDLALLNERIAEALAEADVVLLSGGTSKGQGDLSYRAVAQLGEPGIVAHGVALKPGKPICLAASGSKPVVILPGFPTSAIFTFHEFVAPVIRALTGRPRHSETTRTAKLAVKVNSEIGRTEYLLVGLLPGGDKPDDLIAYPMGKGSGSVTTFSHADGFVTIDRHTEIIPSGRLVDVTLLGRDVRAADLVVIGSHCVGLDLLLGELQRAGWQTKFMAVGSTAGLAAAERGECDLAGVHLLDADSGEYNRPFLTAQLELVRGYRRRQGIICRAGDARFVGKTPQAAVAEVRGDARCVMVGRNRGSGTRILIDRLLADAPGDEQPAGYAVQVKNHHAVAAAIRQGRADWGVAIETVVNRELSFLPLADEEYDFVVPRSRRERPAVAAFVELLERDDIRQRLAGLGLAVSGG